MSQTVEAHALEIARALVRLPSESSDPIATPPETPEAAVAAWIEEWARAHGIDIARAPGVGARENLLLRLPAPGKPRLLIAAHMDTVSARGMEAPFAAEVEEGRLRGRGACDDKGPLAAALAALAAVAEEGGAPAADVTLAATVDEEVTLGGAAALAGSLAPAELCLCLEPTRLCSVHAHKGVLRLRLRTEGVAGHSSRPEGGKNAIEAMLPVLADLRALAEEWTQREDAALGPPTLAVTRIHGGTAINILPDACVAEADVRLLPEQEPDAALAQIVSRLDGRAEAEVLFAAPGMRAAPTGPLVERWDETLAAAGLDPAPAAVRYATDAARLQTLAPCLVWGPGDIAQAHGREEWIDVDALGRAARLLRDFLCTEG